MEAGVTGGYRWTVGLVQTLEHHRCCGALEMWKLAGFLRRDIYQRFNLLIHKESTTIFFFLLTRVAGRSTQTDYLANLDNLITFFFNSCYFLVLK